MLSNKIVNLIVTELFIRGRKLKVSLVLITQYYFTVPKDIRLNCTHDFIMKIPNKQDLQQIASHNSSDIDFWDFMNLYKKFTENPYSSLVIDNTFASDNPSGIRMNLIQIIKKLIMTIDDKIRDEKLHYDINRETAKI